MCSRLWFVVLDDPFETSHPKSDLSRCVCLISVPVSERKGGYMYIYIFIYKLEMLRKLLYLCTSCSSFTSYVYLCGFCYRTTNDS